MSLTFSAAPLQTLRNLEAVGGKFKR